MVNYNDKFLDEIGPEQAWFLGLMASDGCVTQGGSASFSQSKDDGREMVQYVQRLLQHSGKLYEHQTASGNTHYTLYLPKSQLVARLADFGIVNRKTLIYDFPQNLDSKNLAPFIRGYIDGDGCVGSYKVGNSNAYLKIGVFGNVNFIKNLNEVCPIKGKTSNQKNGIQIWWNGTTGLGFGKWVYSSPDLFPSRKYKKFWQVVPLEETKMKYVAKCREEEVVLMLKKGIPPMQVARDLKIPFQTVYKIRARVGIIR